MVVKPRRRLIWVPIVHTSPDLGSVGESVKAIYTKKVGTRGWDRHVQTVNRMWRRIRERMDALDLDYPKVRLYQDGLPECGRELEIVTELARAGSRNHELLLELVEKGARLTGTESPALLIEEYDLSREVLASLASGGTERLTGPQRARSKAILEKRDRHISERIGRTLCEGETGLVFLGMLHSLGRFLSGDIRFAVLGQAVSCSLE